MPLPHPVSTATTDRLLSAGRRLFAQRGYEGASVRAITDAADANLGAVTYHFESKRAFYNEVAEHVLRPLRDAIADATATGGSPMERIEAMIDAFFQILQASPDLPHFMLQEVAQGTDPAPAVLQTMRRVIGALAGIIGEGQQDGSMRPGDPALTAISIIAQPVHLTLVAGHLAAAAELDGLSAAPRTSARDHVLEFVRNALLEPSP